MNDISMEERIAIKDSARSLKKYGSTSSNSKRCENFIKHQVVQSDTLQGLALKYGVTTEQIRRANTLWANDSIFLRKILLIPSSTTRGQHLQSRNNDRLEIASTSAEYNHNNNNNIEQLEPTCSGPNHENDADDDNDDSYNNFLVKIDCAIASTKNQVMISQDSSQFMEDDSIFWRRKSGAQSRLKQQKQYKEDHHYQQQQQQQQQYQHHRDGSSSSTSSSHLHHQQQNHIDDDQVSTSSSNYCNDVIVDVPTTTIVMMTQGRKVRNSLQRLEKQQNDIFEL